MHPSEFDGSSGPLAAKDWIEQVESMLVAALVPEDDKVSVLQIQLIRMARSWFDLLVQSHQGKLSWKDFKGEFDEEFFSADAQDEIVERLEKI